MKLDWVTWQLAELAPANSTDDTDTHDMIYDQHIVWLYGQN